MHISIKFLGGNLNTGKIYWRAIGAHRIHGRLEDLTWKIDGNQQIFKGNRNCSKDHTIGVVLSTALAVCVIEWGVKPWKDSTYLLNRVAQIMLQSHFNPAKQWMKLQSTFFAYSAFLALQDSSFPCRDSGIQSTYALWPCHINTWFPGSLSRIREARGLFRDFSLLRSAADTHRFLSWYIGHNWSLANGKIAGKCSHQKSVSTINAYLHEVFPIPEVLP